jgi:trimethylamine:corrinoid methyltransferase-like protein
LRSEEYVRPRLAVRGPRAVWEAQGAKDTYQLARERVRQYGQHPASPLPESTRATLAEIIASFEKV